MKGKKMKEKKYLTMLRECISSSYYHTSNTGGAPAWTISRSKIHGNGVIANKDLKPGDLIDLAFIKIYNTGDIAKDWRITQFGKHLNHSDNPNAETNDTYQTVALKRINVGEEIAINYRVRNELEQPDKGWK